MIPAVGCSMNKKIYISGPISNMPGGNKEAFDILATKLRRHGYKVVNPFDLDLIDKVETWEDNLRRDIKYLMDCDAIALLPDWELSKGANLEVAIGVKLGMSIFRWKDQTLIPVNVAAEIEITTLIPSSHWI